MNLEDYLKIYKQAKRTGEYSGPVACKLKVYTMDNKREWQIVRQSKCQLCEHESEQRVSIGFKEPHSMTIFEVAHVFLLWSKGQILTDYANFHKCGTGKKFIENIKGVEVTP